MKNNRKFLWIAAACALLSLAVHIYLARQHFSLVYGGESGASICNINEVFNCDAVAASSYSSFLGVPVAVWGLMTNGVYLLLLLISLFGWTSNPERTERYTLWGATVILGASLVMGVISTSMTNFCIFCIGAYALSLVGWVCNYLGVGPARGHLVDDALDLIRDSKWVLGMGLVIPAGAFFISASARSNAGFKDMDRVIAETLRQWQGAEVSSFDESRGLVLYKGTGAPRVTIVEFADFLCPHCKYAYPKLEAFASARPDVKLVFKHFPLDGTCNPAAILRGQGNGIRCQIALTITCEERLRKEGWKAHHYFFDTQEASQRFAHPAQVLDTYCGQRGQPCEDLRQCVSSTEALDDIKAQAQEGENAKILGTPAIFVNGRFLRNGHVLPILEAVYNTSR